jgi:hypothetical protein
MAVRIEKEANESCSSYEWFALQVNRDVSLEMRKMDPVERRFLAACFEGVYVPPHDWQTEYEIRQELRRELYGKEISTELEQYDPVEKTLASLSPEDEQVKYVFIMERDVLPRRKTELAEIQETSYGRFLALGEIEYDLVAKVSVDETRWAVAAQHYDWDDFADRGPHTFDSLEEAKDWLASDRALVTPEWPDPREDRKR